MRTVENIEVEWKARVDTEPLDDQNDIELQICGEQIRENFGETHGVESLYPITR